MNGLSNIVLNKRCRNSGYTGPWFIDLLTKIEQWEILFVKNKLHKHWLKLIYWITRSLLSDLLTGWPHSSLAKKHIYNKTKNTNGLFVIIEFWQSGDSA